MVGSKLSRAIELLARGGDARRRAPSFRAGESQEQVSCCHWEGTGLKVDSRGVVREGLQPAEDNITQDAGRDAVLLLETPQWLPVTIREKFNSFQRATEPPLPDSPAPPPHWPLQTSPRSHTGLLSAHPTGCFQAHCLHYVHLPGDLPAFSATS